MGESRQSSVPAGGGRALRIVFEYDGDAVQLVSRQPVEVIVPRSDPLQAFEGRPGSWVELQDAEGRAVFRRAMPNAIPTDIEAPADEAGQMMRRPVEHPKGVFVALVPDLPQAQAVAVWTSPRQAGQEALAPQAARQVARFPLRD